MQSLKWLSSIVIRQRKWRKLSCGVSDEFFDSLQGEWAPARRSGRDSVIAASAAYAAHALSVGLPEAVFLPPSFDGLHQFELILSEYPRQAS